MEEKMELAELELVELEFVEMDFVGLKTGAESPAGRKNVSRTNSGPEAQAQEMRTDSVPGCSGRTRFCDELTVAKRFQRRQFTVYKRVFTVQPTVNKRLKRRQFD